MTASDFKEVLVHGLTLDPKNNSPVLLLREKGGTRALPIWIGLFEANAIAMHLAGLTPPRPMTHDLLLSAFKEAGLSVTQVAVTRIEENTFYARIVLSTADRRLEIDSRPSDAIALAVRAGCPILVSELVLAHSAMQVQVVDPSGEKDQWLERLEEMDPEQYTKYKM